MANRVPRCVLAWARGGRRPSGLDARGYDIRRLDRRLRKPPDVSSNRADFTRFWLYDVDREAMPRNWVRWAARLAQTTVKVTGGNPADEQHSSYLLDCDLFLSADVRYVSVLDIVRSDAPFSLAKVLLVSGDRTVPVLDRITAVL